jgi:uncharacterized damage-inducible protein DinB
MAASQSIAPHYTGWSAYQESLVKAVAPLTAEQLALQVAPSLRSIHTLAAHIIAARVWWFHFVMGEGPADLEPLVTWDDDGQPIRAAADLAQGLERSWHLIAAGLERWTPADLPRVFSHPRRPERTYTRQWIVWHILEHDLHHGGELSFSLGAHGLPAIDL